LGDGCVENGAQKRRSPRVLSEPGASLLVCLMA